MSSPTNAEAHADHGYWQSETAMWRDDLQQWQKEHDTARLALMAALASHNAGLSDHASSINQHEENIRTAEHHIVECGSIHPATGAKDRDLGKQHSEESRRQEQLREAHERIKRYHYRTMAKVGVLVEVMGGEA